MKNKKNEEKLIELQNVSFHSSQNQFLQALYQIVDKQKFLKNILRKLKALYHVKCIVSDFYGLPSENIVIKKVIRICKDKKLWDTMTITVPKRKRQRLT